jgi:hypothetical protein
MASAQTAGGRFSQKAPGEFTPQRHAQLKPTSELLRKKIGASAGKKLQRNQKGMFKP